MQTHHGCDEIRGDEEPRPVESVRAVDDDLLQRVLLGESVAQRDELGDGVGGGRFPVSLARHPLVPAALRLDGRLVVEPLRLAEVDPQPDAAVVALHGGEDHGGRESVLRLHLSVEPGVERGLEGEEQVSHELLALPGASQPPGGHGAGTAVVAGHGVGGLDGLARVGGTDVEVADVLGGGLPRMHFTIVCSRLLVIFGN